MANRRPVPMRHRTASKQNYFHGETSARIARSHKEHPTRWAIQPYKRGFQLVYLGVQP